jgi:hypothetical protein
MSPCLSVAPPKDMGKADRYFPTLHSTYQEGSEKKFLYTVRKADAEPLIQRRLNPFQRLGPEREQSTGSASSHTAGSVSLLVLRLVLLVGLKADIVYGF